MTAGPPVGLDTFSAAAALRTGTAVPVLLHPGLICVFRVVPTLGAGRTTPSQPGHYPLTLWVLDKMAAISQTTISNTFSWMKMFRFQLTFHWSLFLWLEFNEQYSGADQATNHYLNQWWLVYWPINASLGLVELILKKIYSILFSFFKVTNLTGRPPWWTNTHWLRLVWKVLRNETSFPPAEKKQVRLKLMRTPISLSQRFQLIAVSISFFKSGKTAESILSYRWICARL